MSKRKGREEEQEKVGRDEEEKEGGQVMVDMSKEEGGQEEKGGEEHEELSIMEEDGRKASKKDVGQDMDTIMQTLDALVENIVPPTATAKMPPAGEKKRKVVKAISPSSLTRRVKEGRRTRSQSALFKDLEYEFDVRKKKKVQEDVAIIVPSQFAQYEVRRDYRRRKQLSTDEVRVKILKQGFLEIFDLDTSAWPIVVPTPCPQQGAGDDCALFVCKYMECLSKKNIIGLPFSQADMDLIRGKLASAIIEEINREKPQKSSSEEAVEKIVSLFDEA
ncbi:hypothetical protein Taro_044239 [Colocasia esculenta]|uniref:Ubiquitin-like protease family profile domain-containing protein n=1 Tax=Colocasia esculenta TaxID=4460 RepID=A0A843X2B4_COLES|nr:hypothetical protein [Colocasia esculenta]